MATLYDSGMTGDMNRAYGIDMEEEERKRRAAVQAKPISAPQPILQQAPPPQQKPAQPAQAPAAPAPAPAPQQQTFAQMQQAGMARPNPPAPAPQPAPAPAMTPAQVAPYDGGMVDMRAPAAMNGQGFNLGNEFLSRAQQSGISPEVMQGISGAIANPSAYNSQLVRDIYGQLGQNIDDEFAQRETGLREEMASRGLSDSSIYGGRMQDLNVGRRSARQGLANQLGQMVAQDYSGARDRALGMGMARDQFGNQLGQSYLDRLMGFGQQAFQNDMQQAEFNRQMQNDQDRLMLQMFGLGG